MIVCRSLTPKTSFEASFFLVELPERNRFSYYPPAGALPSWPRTPNLIENTVILRGDIY